MRITEFRLQGTGPLGVGRGGLPLVRVVLTRGGGDGRAFEVIVDGIVWMCTSLDSRVKLTEKLLERINEEQSEENMDIVLELLWIMDAGREGE